MKIDEHLAECQKTFEKLIDKKVIDVKLKLHDHDCWEIYITTDKGKFVVTFCKGWICPMVELRRG